MADTLDTPQESIPSLLRRGFGQADEIARVVHPENDHPLIRCGEGRHLLREFSGLGGEAHHVLHALPFASGTQHREFMGEIITGPFGGWCRHNIADFSGLSYNADDKLSSTYEHPYIEAAMTDDLSRFCCQNTQCSDYGRRGGDNLRVAFRYGPDKQRRLLVCRTCQQRFSERKGTPLFGARLPDEQILDILAHLQGALRRPLDQPPDGRRQGHGRPLRPAGRRPRPATPRRVAGLFPRHPRRRVRRAVVVRRQEGEEL